MLQFEVGAALSKHMWIGAVVSLRSMKSQTWILVRDPREFSMTRSPELGPLESSNSMASHNRSTENAERSALRFFF